MTYWEDSYFVTTDPNKVPPASIIGVKKADWDRVTDELTAARARIERLEAVRVAAEALPEDLPIAGNEMRGETRYCALCDRYSEGRVTPVVHADDCPWLLLHAALADVEATDGE